MLFFTAVSLCLVMVKGDNLRDMKDSAGLFVAKLEDNEPGTCTKATMNLDLLNLIRYVARREVMEDVTFLHLKVDKLSEKYSNLYNELQTVSDQVRTSKTNDYEETPIVNTTNEDPTKIQDLQTMIETHKKFLNEFKQTSHHSMQNSIGEIQREIQKLNILLASAQENVDDIYTIILNNVTQSFNARIDAQNLEIAKLRGIADDNGNTNRKNATYYKEKLKQVKGAEDLEVAVLHGRHYVFVNITMNHSNALEFCKKLDMQLLSIETHYENRLILSHIYEHLVLYGETVWTSAKRQADGSWLWSTGQKLHYVNWRPGQPDGGPTSDCMLLSSNSNAWFSYLCSRLYYVVCEE